MNAKTLRLLYESAPASELISAQAGLLALAVAKSRVTSSHTGTGRHRSAILVISDGLTFKINFG